MMTKGPLVGVLMMTFLAGPGSAQEPHSGTIELGSCDIPGAPDDARCGSYTVFEDRGAAQGRTIDLFVAVLPATGTRTATDALTYLHGGPGAPATSMLSFMARLPLRTDRDIILVDQRGTGRSNGLSCPADDLQTVLDRYIAFDLIGCSPDEWNADTRQYVTTIAVDDLDEVRAALGYDALTIWGGSYGTRAALEYARRHGGRTRALILDGVAPMNLMVPLHFSDDAQASLDHTFADCAEEPTCRAMYPDLHSDLAQALERFHGDTEVSLEVTDPRDGSLAPVSFGRDHFTGALRSALYNGQSAALVPQMVAAGADGDFLAAASFAAAFGVGLNRLFSVGMTMAVICSEDVPFITSADVEAASRGTAGRGAPIKNVIRACEQWPTGEIPGDYRHPVQTAVPVLLLSGEADPVTPPRWARATLPNLPNALQVIFKGMGHGVIGNPCGMGLIVEFVVRGSLDGLDATCASEQQRPPWAPAPR